MRDSKRPDRGVLSVSFYPTDSHSYDLHVIRDFPRVPKILNNIQRNCIRARVCVRTRARVCECMCVNARAYVCARVCAR